MSEEANRRTAAAPSGLQRCVFASDLHQFSRRSQQHRFEQLLRDAVTKVDRLVLGGDIFDFKWSTLGSHRATIDAAISWLDELAQLNSSCRIDYVLGNHDFDHDLMEGLKELSSSRPGFEWHPYWLQLGECLFLHGDVADRRMSHEGLQRKRQAWSSHKKPHPLRHDLYEWALHFRLHKVPSLLVHHPRLVARRLVYYLDRHPEIDRNQVRRIYFGHTHVEIDGLEFAGIRFFNGGAPIRNNSFRLVHLDLLG